jgi:hypothetical protein
MPFERMEAKHDIADLAAWLHAFASLSCHEA